MAEKSNSGSVFNFDLGEIFKGSDDFLCGLNPRCRNQANRSYRPAPDYNIQIGSGGSNWIGALFILLALMLFSFVAFLIYKDEKQQKTK